MPPMIPTAFLGNTTAPSVAPGTSSPNRYSMGATGSITDNGSGIAPTQYQMPGGAPQSMGQAEPMIGQNQNAMNTIGGQASGNATNTLGGYMPSNPTYYGR